jgi:hypothetical protein
MGKSVQNAIVQSENYINLEGFKQITTAICCNQSYNHKGLPRTLSPQGFGVERY